MAQTPPIEPKVNLKPLLESFADTASVIGVVFEVATALAEARAKHGKQDHLPLGIGPNENFMRELGEHTPLITWLEDLSNRDLEHAAKALEQDRSKGSSSWAKIAFEEVAEFLAADNPADARAEALQAAAMFVSIITLIDAHA